MDVRISFNFSEEDDGIQQNIEFWRGGVEDLYTLSQFMLGAVQGAGYSYVKDVGFKKDNGIEIWGDI